MKVSFELLEEIGPDDGRQWCDMCKRVFDVIAEERAWRSSN